ncbi:MAG TPA: hypothetical protein VF524_08585 [Polyangia bacterium]
MGGAAGAPGPDVAGPVPEGPSLKLFAGVLGGSGFRDGVGLDARFSSPCGLASDGADSIFVADRDNGAIRRLSASTAEVTTIAGSQPQDPVHTSAWLLSQALATDGRGNLFVLSSPIRKIVLATGEVTSLPTLSGTGGTEVSAHVINGLAADDQGNLFLTQGNLIRKVVIATGEISTFAGSSTAPVAEADGIGTAAVFTEPFGLAYDGAGSLFVSDACTNTIRRIELATAKVATVAGVERTTGLTDGGPTVARLAAPKGLAIDKEGHLFIADSDNHTIRKMSLATGSVETIAGVAGVPGSTDGVGTAALFRGPSGLALDGSGHLFVADEGNRTIRKIDLATLVVTTFAGLAENRGDADGTGSSARFASDSTLVSDGAGHLFVAELTRQTIRKVILATGEVQTVAGTPGERGSTDGVGAAARFDQPIGMAYDGHGSLFVADEHNYAIRRIATDTFAVTTLAGSPGRSGYADGIGTAAVFAWPVAVVTDGRGALFVADQNNHVIRRIAIATGETTTVVGTPGVHGSTDGIGSSATFNRPNGLIIAGNGDLFVADQENHAIRRVALATREVTTLAGTAGVTGSSDGLGPQAQFVLPWCLASDGASTLFVCDGGNTVRRIDIGMGLVTTVVGSPAGHGVVLGPLPASLNVVHGIAFVSPSSLYLADSYENSLLVAHF